jgi:hypothetical protein
MKRMVVKKVYNPILLKRKDKFQFIELELKALGGKMILYRPVGTKELELIKESNYLI